MARWESAEIRFEKRISISEDGCWEWTGSHSDTGYGCFYDGKAYHAHRYSWIRTNGPIPDGMLVLHRCDNRSCVNPAHLFLGSHRENSVDMVQKGRNSTHDTAGERHGASKLTDAAVREIRASTLTGRELAAKFGVSESAVSLVRRGRSWTHVE